MRFSKLGLGLVVMATAAALGCSGGSADPEASTQGALESTVERPPQFVILAFDGSQSLDFWNESRAFAKQAGVKFTYFISGVYFLADAHKSAYQGPRHNAGKSDIGFGGTAESIVPRIDHLRLAREEGHEVASHANGHFDGSAWTDAEWSREFDQFNKLVFENGTLNGFAGTALGFAKDDVVGFRAPLLGHSPGLFTNLKTHQFAYDTSRSAASNYWPEKLSGIWNFPLAQLKIVGSGKRTLSMDYNFYYAHSNGQSDPSRKEQYKKETLDTYMQYFQSNYFGNRAPLHIGHHFSKWNGGAYWEAMQTFTQRVCSQPEVKCGTYKELLRYVEDHSEQLPAFRTGQFTKMPRPPSAGEPEVIDPAVADKDLEAYGFVGDVAAAHEQ